MNDVALKSTGIIRFDPIAGALLDLEARLKNVVHDVTTADGMAAARKDRAEVRRYRVALEKARIEEKAQALEYGRKVDSTAREITAALVALEDPIDVQIKNEETRKEREKAEREAAEAKRIADIQDEIAALNAFAPGMVGSPSATIADRLRAVREHPIGESFAEFKALAHAAKDKAIATLEQLHAGAVAQEQAAAAEAKRVADERAELARLRAEQDERNRQERARIAELTRQEVEARAKIEAEEKASRERIEEEQRAARLAREEADRKAREEQAKRNAEIEAKDRAARLAREEEDRKARQEARRVREEQEEQAAKIKAERERLEAAQREVEAKRNEILDGEAVLRRFVERFGKRREFAAVVKAIGAHLNRKNADAEQAAARAAVE